MTQLPTFHEALIVPECFVDTKVAEIAGQAKRKYNHQKGDGNVAKELQERLEKKLGEHPLGFLGIIDEDLHKGSKAKYLLEFKEVKRQNNLILKRHKTDKKYLILICPEMEKWLLHDAHAVNIKHSDHPFNLPQDFKFFIKMTKIQDIDRNQGFYQFIKALIRKEAPSITTLKEWLELFKEGKLEKL